MKIYKGVRTKEGHLEVTVNGKPLDMYLHWNFIWHRFECGYGGSGAAQLAFAIVADHMKNKHQTLLYYQAFKWKVVAKLSKEWELTDEEVESVLTAIAIDSPIPPIRALNKWE